MCVCVGFNALFSPNPKPQTPTHAKKYVTQDICVDLRVCGNDIVCASSEGKKGAVREVARTVVPSTWQPAPTAPEVTTITLHPARARSAHVSANAPSSERCRCPFLRSDDVPTFMTTTFCFPSWGPGTFKSALILLAIPLCMVGDVLSWLY